MDNEDYRKWEAYLDRQMPEYFSILKELVSIPAPSHKEEKRAVFVKNFLIEHGYQPWMDQEGNVLVKIEGESDKEIHLYTAHLDTVFPDLEPLKVIDKEDELCAPGIGDDTANVAGLLLILQYLKEENTRPHRELLFGFNVCEEGLGNLAGIREIMKEHGHRVTRHISFDGSYDWISNRAVGSKRYQFVFRTQGGHSYGNFGTPNAIALAARLIQGLYQMEVNGLPDKTTYNVGTIIGGTSVNTIAQEVEFTYEYRSDQNESLELMKDMTRQVIFEELGLRTELLGHELVTGNWGSLEITLIGDRPGMGPVDEVCQKELSENTKERILYWTGHNANYESGSTDCNIPLSMGIPAVCFGVYLGEGQHTREEKIFKSSLKQGLQLAFATIWEEYCHDK